MKPNMKEKAYANKQTSIICIHVKRIDLSIFYNSYIFAKIKTKEKE